jgi:hypothetical protein
VSRGESVRPGTAPGPDRPARSPLRLAACQGQSPLREKPRSHSQAHDQLQSIVLTLAVASRRRGRPEGYAIWAGVVYEGATAVCRQRTTS